MFDTILNIFAQCVHLYGLLFASRRLCSCLSSRSCECCVRACLPSVPRCAKAASHTTHTNGRSPVCVLMCRTRCAEARNDTRHVGHTCAPLLLSCTPRMCTRRLLKPVNVSEQCVHLYDRCLGYTSGFSIVTSFNTVTERFLFTATTSTSIGNMQDS
jgi:hypothetical protein